MRTLIATRLIEGQGDRGITRLSKCSMPCRRCESRHELLDLRFVSPLEYWEASGGPKASH